MLNLIITIDPFTYHYGKSDLCAQACFCLHQLAIFTLSRSREQTLNNDAGQERFAKVCSSSMRGKDDIGIS